MYRSVITIFSIVAMVWNSTTALRTLEILSSSPISDTARPSRRFMKTSAIMIRKRTKKILAMKFAFEFKRKLFVKSNSPISIVRTLMTAFSSFPKEVELGSKIWKITTKEKKIGPKLEKNAKTEKKTFVIIKVCIPILGTSANVCMDWTLAIKMTTALEYLDNKDDSMCIGFLDILQHQL